MSTVQLSLDGHAAREQTARQAPALPLRPYQAEAIDAVVEAESRGVNRPAVVLPCGTGKTVAFAHLIARRPGRALVIAHRDELLEQAKSKLRQVAPTLELGIVKAERDEVAADVVMASIQTIARPSRLTRLGRDFTTVIIDECHHSAAPTYVAALEQLGAFTDDGPLVVGFTATLERADNAPLGAVWQEVAYERGILWMIANGYLCDLRAVQVGTDADLAKLKVSHGDLQDAEIGAELLRSGAIGQVAGAYVTYARDRRGLAFTPTVETAYALAAALVERGISAEALDGTTEREQRRGVLGRLASGATQVVVNCLDAETEILTEQGWVGAERITEGDEVTRPGWTATLALDTGRLEWQPITHIVKRQREPGERMVRITNQTLDMRVTEDHRMVVRAAGADAWSIVEAGTLPSRVGAYELPLAAEYQFAGVALADAELEFLGLFATDGSLNRERASIEISQAATSPVCTEIERILTACNFDWKVSEHQIKNGLGAGNTHRRYRIPKGTIGGRLARRGWGRLTPWLDKSLSPKLLDCTREQFQRLLYGLWLGDGLKDAGNTRPRSSVALCSHDRVLLDRIQAWAVQRGFAANQAWRPNTSGGRYPDSTMGYLRIRDRRTVRTNNHTVPTSGGNPAQFEEGWQAETVWCVTNPNGTIITRRNGKVAVMGQCGVLTEGFDEPSIEAVLIARPTRSRVLYCLDSTTEILTDQGWRGIDDDLGEARAAGFYPATSEVRWTEILGRVERPLAPGEQMYRLVGPSLDIRVTDEHRMVWRGRQRRGRSAEWRISAAADLAHRRAEYEVPIAGVQKAPGVPLTDDELRFVGWFMTDGTRNWTTSQIVICQAEHQPTNEAIRACLEGCGFKYSVYRVSARSRYNRTSPTLRYTISKGIPRGRDKHLRGWGALEPYLDKALAPPLEDLDVRQLGVLLEAMHLGDGIKQIGQPWTRRSYHITTANRTLLDRLQSLCVRRGFKCNVAPLNYNQNPAWVLHIKATAVRHIGGSSATDRPTLTLNKAEPGERVWCVETGTGTLITRRNGKVAMLGNCQMVGRGTRLHPSKDDCLVLDLAGVTARHDLATVAELAGLDPADLEGKTITEALAVRQAREEEARGEGGGEETFRLPGITVKVPMFRSKMRWLTVAGEHVLPCDNGAAVHLVAAGETYRVEGRRRGREPKVLAEGLSLEYARGFGEDIARRFRGGALASADASWRAKPPSPKQLAALKKWRIRVPKAKLAQLTAGDLSDLINTAAAKAAAAKAAAAKAAAGKAGLR